MKKTKIITTIILVALCFTALQAQNANKEIDKIRKEYAKLKSQIALMEKSNGSDVLYCMQLEDNVYDSRTAGERFYNDKTKFYYSGENESGEQQLRMIIQKTVYGIRTTYKEIMYINGSPAFIYIKEEGANKEQRLYLNGGKFLGYSENNVEKSYKEKENIITDMKRTEYYARQRFACVSHQAD